MSDFLQSYQQHVDERAALGIVPKPLDAEQTAQLIELLKNPPADKADFLLNLFETRIPAGVDEAAYVKASFL
ncbi:bifunctional aconitate hydratase 2/2-methylisocitrate dehydratase, partial [Pasteurella multocida subsp. multocida str. Anand1_buffalo]